MPPGLHRAPPSAAPAPSMIQPSHARGERDYRAKSQRSVCRVWYKTDLNTLCVGRRRSLAWHDNDTRPDWPKRERYVISRFYLSSTTQPPPHPHPPVSRNHNTSTFVITIIIIIFPALWVVTSTMSLLWFFANRLYLPTYLPNHTHSTSVSALYIHVIVLW